MPPTPSDVPDRFLVSKGTLRFDRFMNAAIRLGGLGIIIAVFGIFIFIISQVLPLFRSAEVKEIAAMPFAAGKAPMVFGIDEWAELPFYYEGGSDVTFVDAAGVKPPRTLPLTLPGGAQVTAASYISADQLVVIGTSDGQIGTFTVSYTAEFGEGGARSITPDLTMGEFYPVGTSGGAIRAVGYGDGGETKVVAAVQDSAGKPEVHAVVLKQKRSLMGKGKLTKDGDYDLTPMLTGAPVNLRVPRTGDAVLVTTAEGVVDYIFLGGDEPEKRQEFKPFAEGRKIASIDLIFGDVSLVLTDDTGEMTIFSLLVPEGSDQRLFVKTKTLANLAGPATFFARSQRNKLFLTGSGQQVSLRHSTTEQVRWEQNVGFEVKGAVIDAKCASFALLDAGGTLHRYSLDDPHPESGWKAYFGKVWYEGASKPEYTWQSTGGTDDFEPKLSLRPLIHGTLKGTFWALFFAIPVALLAAVYTAQFLRVEVKRIVKPMMEIMASLPSVVLGFLAALWLAPIIENRVPSLFLVFGGVPLLAALVGAAWSRLPAQRRAMLRPGMEWVAFIPLMLLAAWGFWSLGPVLESWICVIKDASGQPVIDAATGRAVADFRAWWPQITGTPFEQRNSLVVGVMMGFAVIPVIFTIAEDALSNVPASLTAASAALGASRWQTLRTVVLPIASSGIFSALMIGLGRAVGETMIVVMATGNTPVMDWNLFNGMRTLSANIATELPEAPVHSTLYRTLFLGALVLFALTFMLNTAAEILRHRLREKYKLV
ncbi:MAG: ABC transporter permease subunit [Verrucomicrobiota bacterium]